MVEISIKYLGDLRCEARHEPSGTVITTDAPVDNEGRGESFSPTDLAATSLGACMLTIMGIAARKQGVDLGDTQVKVLKEMTPKPPRRIAKLTVVFTIPLPASHEKRAMLEEAARNCPVHLSLDPGVEQEMGFDWVG
ncbi:MAG: OsmC family protein [Verrucomicrobia bacterium]|nr:OsmC family protein [Verrucomicrobiota bacterium]